MSGRSIPFGRDPHLVEHGGLVLFSVDVSRVHGYVRFNVFGGSRQQDGTLAGTVELYDGNGQGRASTNHIMLLRPGQAGAPVALPSGRFYPVLPSDLITMADMVLVVASDPIYPRGSIVLGDQDSDYGR
jgi:hypothetical protein